jgi:hypothetical protein
MCNLCLRVGTRYADQLPVPHRLIVDVARRACNAPALRDAHSGVIGGIAISAKPNPLFIDNISGRTLWLDELQVREHHESVAAISPISVLAFETRDDRWPDRSLFEELEAFSPNAHVLRILHRNGNVQYLDVNQALSHFMSDVRAT